MGKLYPIETVGDLKKLLEQFSDDTVIVIRSNHMEMKGFLKNAFIEVDKMTKVKTSTFDAFDYTPYSYESYIHDDENGKECIILRS